MAFHLKFYDGAQKKGIEEFIYDCFELKKPIEVFTSGSTGKPKKITFQLSSALASAKKTCDYFKINQNSNMVLCLDIDTIAAKMQIIRAHFAQCNLICLPISSNPLKNIDVDYDFIAMVPMQLSTVIANGMERKLKNKSVLIGGSPLSEKLKKEISSLQLNVFESFGMSETLSHIALKKITNKESPFSCLPNIKISTDKENALIIHYDEINSQPIITNDLVEIINESTFIWKGRKDFVVNSGGYKLIPEVIESKINILVNRNLLLGKLDDVVLGEKLVLIIEGPEMHVSKKLFSDLHPYEIPKQYCFLQEFPRTITKKIDRLSILSKMSNYAWRSIL